MTLDVTTLVAPSRCVACGIKVDQATTVRGPHGPRPKDFTICFYCGEPMRYDQKMKLQSLTEYDWSEMSEDQRHHVQAISAGYPPLSSKQKKIGKGLREGVSPFKFRDLLGLSLDEETLLQRMYYVFNMMREYGYPAECIFPTLIKSASGKLNGMVLLRVEKRVGMIPVGVWPNTPEKHQEMWRIFHEALPDFPADDLTVWMLGGGRFNASAFVSTLHNVGIPYGPEWKGSSVIFPELAQFAPEAAFETEIVPDMAKIH